MHSHFLAHVPDMQIVQDITFYILPLTTMTADSSTLEVNGNMIALQSVASIAARVRTQLLKGK
jgi:hypothetical protein